MDLLHYDKYLVMFSGGKDSLACLLHIINQGVDKSKIELWHHDVDGNGAQFMDWPVTRAYCKAVAKHFGIKIYFSWKDGGFEGEMLRENQATGKTYFETPDGLKSSGGKGPKNTRLKFPQKAADLRVRWCSAYLKISVADTAIRNQARFNNSRTLVVTGERAEESTARAKYKTFEPHRSDARSGKKKRLIDAWRPVHQWLEGEVWNIIEEYSINPHPAYHLGWSRLSCMSCIFGNADQWASVKQIAPKEFNKIYEYEQLFEITITKGKTVKEAAAKGRPYTGITADMKNQAISNKYDLPVFVYDWEIPAGAFGASGGPS